MNSAVMFSAGVLVNSDYIYVGQVQITIEAENYLTSTPYNAVRFTLILLYVLLILLQYVGQQCYSKLIPFGFPAPPLSNRLLKNEFDG